MTRSAIVILRWIDGAPPNKKPGCRLPRRAHVSNRVMRADLWPALEAGKLTLPIERTFPLDQVADALAMMRANKHCGKIVLTME